MTAPRDVSAGDPLTLNDPAEVLAVLPFCLGYQPQDSLVAVSLRPTTAGRSMGLVARIDLTHLQGSEMDLLRAHLVQDGAAEALLVMYRDALTPSVCEQAERLMSRWRRDGMPVVDCLAVTATGWRSLVCRDLSCCPPEGNPLTGIGGSPAQAEMVLRGVAAPGAHGDRLRSIEADDRRRVRAVMRHAAAAGTAEPARAFEAWRAALEAALMARRDGGRIVRQPVQRMGELAAALARRRLRDALLVDAITPGDLPFNHLWEGLDDLSHVLTGTTRPPVERLDAAREVLTGLARATEAGTRSDALAALAWVEWYAGDLGLARDIAQRALTLVESQSLALLVWRLAVEGVPPQWARPQTMAPAPST